MRKEQFVSPSLAALLYVGVWKSRVSPARDADFLLTIRSSKHVVGLTSPPNAITGVPTLCWYTAYRIISLSARVFVEMLPN